MPKAVSLYLIKTSLVVIIISLLTLKLKLLDQPIWLTALVIASVFGLVFPLFDEKFLYPLYVKKTQLKGVLSRSLIFLVVFIPLAVFIVTSSSSPLGIGFVFGFMVTTAVDLIANLSTPEKFQRLYLFQFARDFVLDEQRLIAFGFGFVSFLIVLLAVT